MLLKGFRLVILKFMAHLPSSTALRMFVEAAKLSSFARAAETLNVTQPAISKQIASLEARVGAELFRRRHRSVELTEAGEAYLPFAENVVELLESGRKNALFRSERESLNVVIDHEFLNFVLVPRLNSLRRALPNVDVAFVPETASRISPSCDVAITFGHPSNRDFRSERLCRFRAFAVGTPELIASSYNPLKDLPLLHDEDTYWWDAILKAESIVRNTQGVFLGTGATALRAAMSGAGLAVGDDLLCADALNSGLLVKAGKSSLPGRIDFWVSVGKARKQKPATHKFVECVKEILGALMADATADH